MLYSIEPAFPPQKASDIPLDHDQVPESTLSEQLAHSAVNLHLKEISEFLHGSEVNKNPSLP